jgi:hypothetical protein
MPEVVDDHLGDGRIVVDHQNTRVHRCESRNRPPASFLIP